jgi:hypothetical protein
MSHSHVVYATCSDKCIREIADPDPENKEFQLLKGKEKTQYLECISYSQVLVGLQRKMIVAGVHEEDKPGSIQFFRHHVEPNLPTMEKVIEMQAHSSYVEEMRLTIDSRSLFTAGNDGSICCFYIEDKELLKHRKERDYSEEILIEKQTQEELMQQIKSLTESIQLEKNNHQA